MYRHRDIFPMLILKFHFDLYLFLESTDVIIGNIHVLILQFTKQNVHCDNFACYLKTLHVSILLLLFKGKSHKTI